MTLSGWLVEDLGMETVVPLLANSLSMLTIMSFTIMTLYNYLNNYGLMSYMEYPIILLQVYVMMYFVLKYKGMLDTPIAPLMTVIYFAGIAGFLMEILHKDILSYLVPLCTPLSGFAKVTYIYGIIKTGNAENVSLVTWIISMLTNVSRVFTVYVDSADPKLLFNFFVSTILSSGVLGTAIFYQAMARTKHRVARRKTGRRRSHND
ncbi:PQ loop repeat-containing protein 3 [Operophtera brumata]|uniref:PQ loop repeat-containing protein 3 n=1 Tax=Operophtera brumata TaxID=104452 RepID=A0A0L7KYU0_OPEBR|nr:PQ loop repeat-containing protein 3 [Operophtera brumata]